MQQDFLDAYLSSGQRRTQGRSRHRNRGARTGWSFVAVFEDDERSGYLYAVDTTSDGNPIKDAIQIYAVSDVSDRQKPCTLRIGWSMDHSKVVLLINDYPHAVFDFEAKEGFLPVGFSQVHR